MKLISRSLTGIAPWHRWNWSRDWCWIAPALVVVAGFHWYSSHEALQTCLNLQAAMESCRHRGVSMPHGHHEVERSSIPVSTFPETSEELSDWISRLRCTGTAHGFHVEVHIGAEEQLSTNRSGSSRVPLDLEMIPQGIPGSESQTTLLLLAFLQDIELHHPPLQCLHLTLQGAGHGIQVVHVELRLWTKSNTP